MEDTVAWLLQAVSTHGDITFHVVAEPIKMTLEACIELAKEINNNREASEIVMCMPEIVDLGLPT